jgi:hypothetical protein
VTDGAVGRWKSGPTVHPENRAAIAKTAAVSAACLTDWASEKKCFNSLILH